MSLSTETTALNGPREIHHSPDDAEGTPPGFKPVRVLASVTIRFAGDSGDGMQLAGTQFTDTSALVGNDISTLPDFPAEIRAPAGTLAGVSGFQVHFSSTDTFCFRCPQWILVYAVIPSDRSRQRSTSRMSAGLIVPLSGPRKRRDL
jgi:hypothetical protein